MTYPKTLASPWPQRVPVMDNMLTVPEGRWMVWFDWLDGEYVMVFAPESKWNARKASA